VRVLQHQCDRAFPGITTMFQRLLPALLLFCLIAGSASAQVSYTSVRPFGYDLKTMDIVWPTTSTGYAVAQRNTGTDPIRGAVLKSVDEGATWTMITRDGVNLYDIDAINETTVITVGSSLSCGCAVIQRTTDAGSNWTEQTFATVSELRAVDFTSATVGYAVGASGAVMKTTDAGANWTNIGPGPSESVTFTSLSFSGPSVGYAVAMYTALVEPNRVYKTTDAGATWTKIMDQGTDANKPVFFDVWATSDQVIYLAGREIVRRLFKSTDGGATWKAIYNGLPAPLPFGMNAIEFVNDTLGFAAGDYGTLLRTTNAGAIWTKEDPGTLTALTAIGFASPYNGIFGGLSGELYRRAVTELPTVNVSASSLNFGTMATGSKDLELIVSPGNSVVLTIEGIEVNDFDEAGFSLVEPTGFPIELSGDEEQTVTVRFTPVEGLNRRVFGQLTITTNDARTPEKTVSLLADATTSTATPQISISTDAVRFGTLIERQSKTMSLEISAATEEPLVIDSLWINRQSPGAEAFSIVSPDGGFPITVAPGQPLTVTLRYAPMAPTEFPAAADLVILSNDPDNTELRVALSGEADVDPSGVEDEALRSALAITTSPNPVGQQARIAMTIPHAGHLTARLVDATGSVAATLVDAPETAGPRSYTLDAGALPSGTYTLVVTLDGRTVSSRVSIVR